jgi:hypothetical protein
MPGTHENGSGESRLDRLEGLMALLIEDHVQFREEHKQLLTAQVVLTDRLDRFIKETAEAHKHLTEAQKHTDERLNALITIVDGVIRKRPDLPS